MIYITVTGPRTFSVGAGSPAAHERVTTDVTMPPLRADAGLDSLPDSFDIDMRMVRGLVDLFWPAPIGSTVTIYRTADASLVASGTLTNVSINKQAVQISVQL